MKKAITALGIGAVAVSVSSINASALEKGIVTASALNIRSGPSSDCDKVAKLYKGKTVEILEKSNGWYKVRVSSSVVGWGSAKYISTSGSSEGTSNQNNSTSSGTTISGNGKVNVSSRLNVRSGAGTNYSLVGKANNGDVVKLLEQSNGWYKIKLSNGVTGWASSQYISKTSEDVGTNNSNSNNSSSSSTNNSDKKPSSEEAIEGKNGKVISTVSLNVRSGPGTSYSIIGKLNGGDVVELKAKNNGWYKVKLSSGTTGWVSASYISETNEGTKENPNSSSNQNSQSNSNSNSSFTGNSDKSTAKGSTVVDFAYTLIGIPYQWGASGPDKFDCSGFTQYVFKNSVGVSIPRVSREQAKSGSAISMGNYAPGDLVYFDTDGDGTTNHVGIYVGNSKFIHCSGTQTNPNKVKVDNLTSSYWSKALLGARRFA
ncbi:SH3 domain-containing protein [Clostridioides sp. ES-S-0108-01]|uniref:C40 family peptidase n=1 Tax=unclassified Clostridioides TaxID=2635829 RepID=UPI001D0C3304|nr:SH3 domain-containing protein [Clostridioides sp. ES-S-0171-01]MCC0686959.1 SH3 domain-containing protein [Clostridioides sp. ES-S-0056-01]MCC0714215.1 SH3 domain-containing protein [Clostridioides sp. ES-S-0077-01]MCC0783014.1 SH3 domain-containing protein [Clostridioides sp. ES-S-0108-01]UDN52066.1 SH3 domain-containing protein [Clostridioides sp. ES-S-0107-01]UDN55606.1 SH3 domain-containing protein [Clostridioides sp. ES-S-0054-01]